MILIIYLMRSFFLCAIGPILILLAFCGSVLHAQKVLQIEKYGKAETQKIPIGTTITYQLKGQADFYTATIEDILVEKNLLVMADRYVAVDQIAAFRYDKKWAKALSRSLVVSGLGWSAFALVGTATDGIEDTNYRWADAIVTGSALTVAWILPKLFNRKILRFDKRTRLRVLNLSFYDQGN